MSAIKADARTASSTILSHLKSPCTSRPSHFPPCGVCFEYQSSRYFRSGISPTASPSLSFTAACASDTLLNDLDPVSDVNWRGEQQGDGPDLSRVKWLCRAIIPKADLLRVELVQFGEHGNDTQPASVNSLLSAHSTDQASEQTHHLDLSSFDAISGILTSVKMRPSRYSIT